MKPSIATLKTRTGRKRVVGYKAYLGPISADGDTRAAAKVAFDTAVYDALQRLNRGTLVGVWRGHTYVVSPTPYGWKYWLDVFGRADYSLDGRPGETRDAVQDAAMKHLATSLWTFEDDDVTFVEGLSYPVRGEVLSYLAWQRGYRRLTTERGFSDTMARNILGGLEKEPAEAAPEYPDHPATSLESTPDAAAEWSIDAAMALRAQ